MTATGSARCYAVEVYMTDHWARLPGRYQHHVSGRRAATRERKRNIVLGELDRMVRLVNLASGWTWVVGNPLL